jgi:undecaprenyl diphosphate synthase
LQDNYELESIRLEEPQGYEVPRHVAIIMDGNGRWAKLRNMPRSFGHAKGASNVKSVVNTCISLGVECLTLFAFSTENWGRPSDEISSLMGLFVKYLDSELSSLVEAGVRLKVIGDICAFSSDLQRRIQFAQEKTQNNSGLVLCVAANYGGHWDIVQAIKGWVTSNPSDSILDISASDLAKYLSTAGLPDLDLLIRTGGESRVSNFLLWQIAYAELYFTDSLWPEFDEVEIKRAIRWYGTRERRYGKAPSKD